MKHKIKKTLSLALVVVMLALTACGNVETNDASSAEKSSEETPKQEVSAEEEDQGITFPLEEAVTFTVMNNYFGDDNKLADNPVVDLLSEQTNVHFEFTEVVRAESVEKANLLFASGGYPDVFFKLPDLDWPSLGADGFVIPLEDLIREYMPNLTALLDEKDGWGDITEADGHIYTLPNIGQVMTNMGSVVLWYNKSWADAVGMQEPTNMDELYELLKAFKENDVNGNGDSNDEIPLHLNMNQTWSKMQGYMTDGTHWHNDYMALLEDGEFAGKITYYPRTEEFKDNLLKYMVQWYQEGLIDPNCFTQTYEQSTSIGQTSNIYGMFWNTWPTQGAPEANNTEYYSLKPFEDGYFPLKKGVTKGGMAITDKCENPEILIAWADQLYSEEGGRLVHLGREGIDYTMNDDGSYTPNPEKQWTIQHGCATPGFQAAPVNNANKGDATYQNDELFKKMRESGAITPSISFTDDEYQRFTDLNTNIKAYMENYVAEVIIGEQSLDDTWEEFKTTLIEMGVEELESLYQAAYDRAN